MAEVYISYETIFLPHHFFTFCFTSLFTFTYPFPSFLLTKPNERSYICLHPLRREGGPRCKKIYTPALLLDTNLKTFNLKYLYLPLIFSVVLVSFLYKCFHLFTLLSQIDIMKATCVLSMGRFSLKLMIFLFIFSKLCNFILIDVF